MGPKSVTLDENGWAECPHEHEGQSCGQRVHPGTRKKVTCEKCGKDILISDTAHGSAVEERGRRRLPDDDLLRIAQRL